ncbi:MULTISPECIES: DUF4424 family protein [Moraxella]|jgi:hypothetical protein|uniref:DUF4424 domain-containing protein n=1 Tax=Moraxella lacunata TaxID=477 RepID=A0A1B8Q3V0_MORLA|nr:MULTISPECIES: DUF4424 family protein [Moraxella]MBE9579041.1 DUF4424 family protein [Moraxella sp. K1664]MBE9588386.1 DUF4424 family protein [Moraxella sp. K1630]MBE9590970.1 DUF4424 family protein [Moraxella sp. K127]MBE9596443.1 DUF4424 family protein [Moraxella sp. K2450]MDI4482997.1 DUF4424 domain-containing protein [Moraxella lacunata]
MKRLKFSLLALLLSSITVHANDSTGYVGVGGVAYIKNPNIAMKSEDLYISKDIIKVAYEFKNLTNKDIRQTVLFPLPKMSIQYDGDFADTETTLNSFKVWANGKAITPKMHVRAFLYKGHDEQSELDVTDAFRQCGFSDKEILSAYHHANYDDSLSNIYAKIRACKHPTLYRLITEKDTHWKSQAIYEWTQTFKANAITRINHSYRPMVGGGVFFDESLDSNFCLDKATRQNLDKKSGTHPLSYSALGYVLTTGANWAKPIERFKLTIERDSDEIVSFCWAGKGKVRKVGQGKFEVIENNFVPTQDIDVAFIRVK